MEKLAVTKVTKVIVRSNVSVRIIDHGNGDVWFVGVDVAKALGYSDPNNAVRRLVNNRNMRKASPEEMLALFTGDMPVYIGSGQSINIINGDGVVNIVSRCDLLVEEDKKSLLDCLGMGNYMLSSSRKEIVFGMALADFMEGAGFEVIPQYHVCPYCIDFFIPGLDLAIEYDENDHAYYDKDEESKRERFIKDRLGCDFVRVSDRKSNEYNLGVIARWIYKKNAPV